MTASDAAAHLGARGGGTADIAAATLGTILIALGVLVVAAVYGGVVCRGDRSIGERVGSIVAGAD